MMVDSLITGFVAIIVCVINNKIQHDRTMTIIEYKINILSDRVDKHNNLIERMYELEKHNEIQYEMIKVANHRIDDLENKGGNKNDKKLA